MKAPVASRLTCDRAYLAFAAIGYGATLMLSDAFIGSLGESGWVVAMLITFFALPFALVGVALAWVCRREWPLLALAPLGVASSLSWRYDLTLLRVGHVIFLVTTVAAGAWWVAERRSAWGRGQPGGEPAS